MSDIFQMFPLNSTRYAGFSEMPNKRRQILSVPLAMWASGILTACSSSKARDYARPATAPYDAIVDASHVGSVGKNVDGTAQFRTVEQALDAAPDQSERPWRISLRPGRYREKIEIVKPNIQLIGTHRDECVVTYDAYSGQTRPVGVGTWTTFGCATLTVRAPGFAATNLTIENAYDYLDNDRKPPTDPTYTNDPQAVALMLAKGSDCAVLSNVKVAGFQDTLFVDAGRSYFRNCEVSGNVDFIFGAGQALFETCAIVSRPRRKPNVFPHGYITAPSTQIAQPFGLVFLRCKLSKESALVPPASTALGRPWHPAVTMPDGRYADPNAIGSSVFIECFMDDHIAPDGWWSMTGLQKQGSTRTTFYPEDSRFFEHRSSGPGAASATRKRRQLTEAQAHAYSVDNIFGNWHPQTPPL